MPLQRYFFSFVLILGNTIFIVRNIYKTILLTTFWYSICSNAMKKILRKIINSNIRLFYNSCLIFINMYASCLCKATHCCKTPFSGTNQHNGSVSHFYKLYFASISFYQIKIKQ